LRQNAAYAHRVDWQCRFGEGYEGESAMRRSDREVKDHSAILDILNRCDVIRLGINTPDFPYVVPMNFGTETEGESLILWFHCAPEGLKLDNIKKDPRVGFEADCSRSLIPGKNACYYTMEYESVIGCGNISILTDDDSKLRGLKAIMRHYAPEEDFSFTEPALAPVCVLRLDVTQITGKRLT
jgi:nitroimidazol reductase NimA-like FMN-containing flavoprotein (pyridoxamine 5'-phosphate oxidase superfamily)